jgi:hypothetical protein
VVKIFLLFVHAFNFQGTNEKINNVSCHLVENGKWAHLTIKTLTLPSPNGRGENTPTQARHDRGEAILPCLGCNLA